MGSSVSSALALAVRFIVALLALTALTFSFAVTPVNEWGTFLPLTSGIIDKVDLQYIFVYFLPFALVVLVHIAFSPDNTNGAATALEARSAKRHSIDDPKLKVAKAKWTWSAREIILTGVLILCNILWIVLPMLARYVPTSSRRVDRSFVGIIMGIARKAGDAGMWNAALAIVFVIRENHMMKALLGQHAGSYHNVVRFHVAVGYISLFWLTFHTAAYLVNFTLNGNLARAMLPWESEFGYTNFLGLVSWIALYVLSIFSVFKIRRVNFLRFYLMHQLYIVFLVFAFVHYFGTFYPMIAPLLYFVWDRLSPRLNMKRTVEIRATKLTDNLIHIEIPLLPGYRNSTGYAPGDWINLRIPSISKFQWHPFSIESYFPESPDTLSFMVAVRGTWTRKLKDTLTNSTAPTKANVVSPSASDISAADSGLAIFRANVDGIFGSRHTAYLAHDTLVLVGAGTGVAALTPFLKHYLRARPEGTVHFVWVARSADAVAAHCALVCELNSAGVGRGGRTSGDAAAPATAAKAKVHLHLYLTRENEESRRRKAARAQQQQMAKRGSLTGIAAAEKLDAHKRSQSAESQMSGARTPSSLASSSLSGVSNTGSQACTAHLSKLKDANGSGAKRGRNYSRFVALFLALSVFGAGIGLYCAGRSVLMRSHYIEARCGLDDSLYKTPGYAHFICFYYFYMGPAVFSVLGAAVAGAAVVAFSAIAAGVVGWSGRGWVREWDTARPTARERDRAAAFGVVKALEHRDGRPDFKEIFEKIEMESVGADGGEGAGVSVGVMGAGPEGVLGGVKDAIVGNPKFAFYRESWKV